jgi:hypothetical protein
MEIIFLNFILKSVILYILFRSEGSTKKYIPITKTGRMGICLGLRGEQNSYYKNSMRHYLDTLLLTQTLIDFQFHRKPVSCIIQKRVIVMVSNNRQK